MAVANSPDLSAELADLLNRGCQQLDLDVSEVQLDRLLQYLGLLGKWNRAYNLTAVRTPDEMVIRHLLDSLAIAPYLSGQRILDVGTGAGLPGVPLAVMYPQRDFHLLDSNGKKTRFLFQVKTALGLDNMKIHQARVEGHSSDRPYHAILSRAFASLDDMVRGCSHLLAPDGRFLAMKGTFPEEELRSIEGACRVLAVHVLRVPGLDEQRHLVELAPLEA